MVVAMQPNGERIAAFLFTDVGPGVGPFVEEGAVEAFDLPVGLWTVGAGAFVGDPCIGQCVGSSARAVAGAVVGQDALDGDPGLAEEVLRPGPERGGGLFLLIGEDLAVGQAGIVLNGVVEIAVAPANTVLAADLTAQHLMAATVGDVAELLDIDMYQVAWCGVLVASDDASRGAVQVRQAGDSVSAEYSVHGGWIETE